MTKAVVNLHARRWRQGSTAPPGMGDDLAGRFAAKSAAMSSTVETVADIDAVPAAVARHLVGLGLSPPGCLSGHSFPGWPGGGGRRGRDACRHRRRCGGDHRLLRHRRDRYVDARLARKRPATTSLLPKPIIAIVPVSRIVPAMEEAFALLRAERGEELCVPSTSSPGRRAPATSNRPSCSARTGLTVSTCCWSRDPSPLRTSGDRNLQQLICTLCENLQQRQIGLAKTLLSGRRCPVLI